MGGRTHLVGTRQDDNKGLVEQAYVLKDAELQAKANYDFGASFTSKGKGVLFGCVDGNVIVWDKNKAEPMCGLDHGEGRHSASVVCAISLRVGGRSVQMW